MKTTHVSLSNCHIPLLLFGLMIGIGSACGNGVERSPDETAGAGGETDRGESGGDAGARPIEMTGGETGAGGRVDATGGERNNAGSGGDPAPSSGGIGGEAGAPNQTSCVCSNGDSCEEEECPPGPNGHVRVLEVAAGWNFTCARSESGRIYCWGESAGGTLGDGLALTTHRTFTAAPVAGVVGARRLVAAGLNACMIDREGYVRCWGTNSFDQLEIDPSLGGSSTPVGLRGVSSQVIDVAIGIAVDGITSHGCVVASDSAVRCWGNNAYLQLGTDDVPRSDVALNSPQLTGFRRISASGLSSCGITEAGAVRCWGARVYGQLGDGLGGGAAEPSADPVAAVGLSADVLDLASSSRASCAILGPGNVKCWGSPGQGALGVGDNLGQFAGAASTPVDVIGLPAGVRRLAAGQSHFCALSNDGKVWCWGATFDTSPVVVNGLEETVAVGAGRDHTCVAPEKGGVMCWGSTTGSGSAATGRIETPQFVTGL